MDNFLQKRVTRHRKSTSGDPVDGLVGSRVRLRRVMLGISQGKLAEAMDLTFQQAQKYESGRNRISASKLHRLSEVLEVPISFFFDDRDPLHAPPIDSDIVEVAAEVMRSDPLRQPETAELVAAYYAISDVALRRHLVELANALGAKEPLVRRRRSTGRLCTTD